MKTKTTSSPGPLSRARFTSLLAIAAAVMVASSSHAATLVLFETDYYSGTIHKFTSDGARRIVASGLIYPIGLAADNEGNLFAADSTGTIYKFTPDGTRSTFASGLNNPFALAFDSAGNLFEADEGSGTIYEFAPDGTRSTFASGIGNGGGMLAFRHHRRQLGGGL